jgi:hypothetical protein
VRSPGTFQPRIGSLGAAPSPIGLTAADLFAGGEVSRADSRVRWPGTFTDACCPAVRSALDGVLEAYHNPAAVWWGAFAASAVIQDQVVIVNRISSSGRSDPDRFRLDQRAWSVLPWTAPYGVELQPKLQPPNP